MLSETFFFFFHFYTEMILNSQTVELASRKFKSYHIGHRKTLSNVKTLSEIKKRK